ncbi:hypothetical protein [Serratia marcescens]|uniref:hypothetical protein n=1 Tax=Serratia marcescens TaxID=615 RepID=UPI00074506C0|nr:hypothetical protein [Serratia marcescens]CUY57661.1 Uncharacterised protein [Serratia marcescens]CVD11891.1 Uncharacterised protein [Serratia marcescens]CVF64157.1 Uncharacterised protein [Serratia marcescens]
MDNKLSELSKPVAWKLHHHDRYYFEENADVVAIAESMAQAKGDAVYSQEYVSALLAENERVASDLVARNGEIEGLRKRAAELEAEITNIVDSHAETVAELRAKLATPVRLKKVDSSNVPFAGDGFNAAVDYCAAGVRAAGFSVTVEGDE